MRKQVHTARLATLLSCEQLDLPAGQPTGLKSVASLDIRATLGPALMSWPNSGDMLVDHTVGGAGGYYAVVRLLDQEGNLLYELHGYDPARFEWVRLSDTVNLGPAHRNTLVAVLLTPVAIAIDVVVLAGAVVSSGGGGSWSR